MSDRAVLGMEWRELEHAVRQMLEEAQRGEIEPKAALVIVFSAKPNDPEHARYCAAGFVAGDELGIGAAKQVVVHGSQVLQTLVAIINERERGGPR